MIDKPKMEKPSLFAKNGEKGRASHDFSVLKVLAQETYREKNPIKSRVRDFLGLPIPTT